MVGAALHICCSIISLVKGKDFNLLPKMTMCFDGGLNTIGAFKSSIIYNCVRLCISPPHVALRACKEEQGCRAG